MSGTQRVSFGHSGESRENLYCSPEAHALWIIGASSASVPSISLLPATLAIYLGVSKHIN